MNQLPLISAVPMRSTERLGHARIFECVVMQCHDPAGARIALAHEIDPVDLLRRNHPEGIGEGKVRIGV